MADAGGTADEWVDYSHRTRVGEGLDAVPAGRVGQRARDPLREFHVELGEIRDEIVDGERPGALALWEDICDSLGVERGVVARRLYILDHEITLEVCRVMQGVLPVDDFHASPTGGWPVGAWHPVFISKMVERGLTFF